LTRLLYPNVVRINSYIQGELLLVLHGKDKDKVMLRIVIISTGYYSDNNKIDEIFGRINL